MTSSHEDRLGPDQGPGDRLRHERETSGLSTQQVAEQLNLDVVVIESIEANDFPALGAPVFARGHLRRYAALLGLPDAELLSSYDRARHPEQPTLVPRAHLEHVPEREPARWPLVLVGVLALAAAGALFAVFTSSDFRWPWQSRSVDADTAPAAVSDDEPGAGATPGVANGEPGGTLDTRPSSASGVTAGSDAPVSPTLATQPGAVAGLLRLEFAFTQDSWIEIFDGTGKAVLYDLGAAGSRRAVSAQAPLNVTIGNAPAVALTVNGKPVTLPSPEPGQTVVRVKLDKTGRIG